MVERVAESEWDYFRDLSVPTPFHHNKRAWRVKARLFGRQIAKRLAALSTVPLPDARLDPVTLEAAAKVADTRAYERKLLAAYGGVNASTHRAIENECRELATAIRNLAAEPEK